MGATDELHQLIHCLSKTEKRYFRLYSEIHGGDKKYQHLFDLLDGMDAVDEEKLISGIAVHIAEKDLHVARNYLLNLILRSMRSYREGKSVESKLHNLIEDIHFFDEKGLGKSRDKFLRKAIKLSQSEERASYRIELLSNLNTHSINQLNSKLLEHQQELIGQMSLAADTLRQEIRMREIYSEVFILRRSIPSSDKAELKKRVQESTAEVHKLDEKVGFLSRKAELQAMSILMNEQNILGNPVKGLEYNKRGLDIWEANQELTHIERQNYLAALSNYIGGCFHKKDWEEMKTAIEKYRKVPINEANLFDRCHRFEVILFYEQLYYMNIGELEQALALGPEIAQGMETFESYLQPSRFFAFCYNLAILHFAADDYEGADDWLLRIDLHKRGEHRMDIQRFARLFRLVVQYELGNREYVISQHSAVYKWLHAKAELNPFERILLKGMQKMASAPNSAEVRTQQEEMLGQLEALGQDDRILGISEIELWLKSRLNGRAFAELLKEG